MPGDTLPLDAHPLTMSSLEISGLTAKRHDNLLRDVKTMLVGLYGERGTPFDKWAGDPSNLRNLGTAVSWETDERGYVSLFHMDKGHTLTLVAGYNVKLRKRIIDRWMALEASIREPEPLGEPRRGRSFAEALRMINSAARVWDAGTLRQLWLGEAALPKVSGMYERDRQFDLPFGQWAHQPPSGAAQ